MKETYGTGACTLEDLGEELSGRRDVRGPSEPSGVAGIEVQPDVVLLELRDCVRHEFLDMPRQYSASHIPFELFL